MPSSYTPSDNIWVKVSEELPSLQECHDFCADPSCGAISSFVGTTRDTFQSKKVLRLWYEAYTPMAEKEMRKLCSEAASKYGLKRVAAVHKVGDCPVGQASVVLVCSSPHRNASLEACSYLINELKARVPIWKREVYEGDADAVWKENIEWNEGKAKRVMVKE